MGGEMTQMINEVGLPIAVIVICFLALAYVVKRYMDKTDSREDKLIDANSKYTEALNKVTDTIEESNKVNRELSETNKLLVEKVEDKLVIIGHNIDRLIEKEESSNK